MKRKIDWSTAQVTDGTLTVSLTESETAEGLEWASTESAEWDRIFDALAQQPLPGVSYAPSDMWGHIQSGGQTITVDHVPRDINLLRGQLTAAVQAANEEAEKQRVQRQREAAGQREEQERQQAADSERTERFRQFGEQ